MVDTDADTVPCNLERERAAQGRAHVRRRPAARIRRQTASAAGRRSKARRAARSPAVNRKTVSRGSGSEGAVARVSVGMSGPAGLAARRHVLTASRGLAQEGYYIN